MKKTWITRNGEDDLFSRLHGTNGNDYFVGDDGNREYFDAPDIYQGRAGNDLIYGLDDQDRLWGAGGTDTIYGGNGSDRLFGGPGNDTLFGERHGDIMTGGSGADVFRFNAWSDDSGGSGLDIITDFDPQERGEHVLLGIAQGLDVGTFAELRDVMVQDDNDVVINIFDGVILLVLEDVRIGQLRADDFHIFVG